MTAPLFLVDARSWTDPGVGDSVALVGAEARHAATVARVAAAVALGAMTSAGLLGNAVVTALRDSDWEQSRPLLEPRAGLHLVGIGNLLTVEHEQQPERLGDGSRLVHHQARDLRHLDGGHRHLGGNVDVHHHHGGSADDDAQESGRDVLTSRHSF